MTKVLFLVAMRWERWDDEAARERAAAVPSTETPYGGDGLAPYAPHLPYGPDCGVYGPDTGAYGPGAYGPECGAYGPTDAYGPDSAYGPESGAYGPDCAYGPDSAYGPDRGAYGPDSAPRCTASASTASGAKGGRAFAYSSGLRNSVMFQASMLVSHGINASVAEVPGPYQIHDQILRFQPTHVIVEAIWVVPTFLAELRKRHPHVRFAVRNHSPTQFLSGEWSGYGFIRDYLKLGFEVMANDPRSVEDLKILAHAHGVSEHLVTYAPNFYPEPAFSDMTARLRRDKSHVDVALFGAIRPLKAHIVQAFAALHFAGQVGKRLRLHINGGRIDMNAGSELNNVRNLFAGSHHELVQHRWHPHDEFRAVMRGMDIALASNFSESYCIVAADAAAEGVPLVANPEVPWVGAYAWADPARSHAIARLMTTIWEETPAQLSRRLHQQRRDMLQYNQATQELWRRKYGAWIEADIAPDRVA
jgi:hypothetical protein